MSRTGKKKSFVDYELPTKDLEKVRGGRAPITTMAVGEEGGPPVTTMAVGEETGTFTTLAVGEETGCAK
ncbi:hypothetical protein [Archangium sp.]|uniref:hypothetical protein n=1 Tax=Archangium sp. TaxID=1872627 RepID=UPI00389AF3C6